jgi:dynamin-binding protein
MTPEDTKIIFSNVVELLILSEALCQELEGALGSMLEGGAGQDHVGEVFFDFVSNSSILARLFVLILDRYLA